MGLLNVIILGIIQGITEFIPISSSGHLVIFQHFMEVDGGITLNVFLHFGSLLAVAYVFREEIIGIITLKEKYRRLTYFIIVGSIPAGVIGILFEDFFEEVFSTLTVVGFALLVTGSLLWLSDKVNTRERPLENMKWGDAIFVGIAQALAIFPGISRSGSTIVGGLFKGLNRELAARFSFLLAMPVIGGATLLQARNIFSIGLDGITAVELTAGTIASTIASFFAIKVLLILIRKEKLSIFAYYCWVLGLTIIFIL
ncbi:undecaprenyl-diphosphatase UppP [Halanaerobiaceae bacterium Z-7014]|uniref:Undecaprenyl-diphosphatase n=1 Tax=Halonatronomonas betaini TaxID=2778430 RepID=A0A931F994_9FIRM|nr:undecaprenyl-diphosphatase UppP [Halonatronomonas betaini]MBF8437338.1 undecaprenyl-diphosphatase UppP [Halonatronomonas betaini]